MKLGTESRKKTIAACVLGGVAVILALNWMLNSGSSPQAAAPVTPAQVVSPATPDNNSVTDRQTRKRDEKMLSAPFKSSLDPSLNLKMLEESERIEYKGSGRNIFDMTTQPEIPPPLPGFPGRKDANANVPPPPPVRQGPPPPPPINLKFYGFSTKNGQKTVFLVQNPASPDSVFVAHEGDIVARRYKILRINQSSVEIQDLLSNNKQTISLSPG